MLAKKSAVGYELRLPALIHGHMFNVFHVPLLKMAADLEVLHHLLLCWKMLKVSLRLRNFWHIMIQRRVAGHTICSGSVYHLRTFSG